MQYSTAKSVSCLDLSSSGKALWGQFNKNSVYKVWAGEGEMRAEKLSNNIPPFKGQEAVARIHSSIAAGAGFPQELAYSTSL